MERKRQLLTREHKHNLAVITVNKHGSLVCSRGKKFETNREQGEANTGNDVRHVVPDVTFLTDKYRKYFFING